jgi:hypothetical protein
MIVFGEYVIDEINQVLLSVVMCLFGYMKRKGLPKFNTLLRRMTMVK